MSKNPDKRDVYEAVKNIIHNEMGVNRSVIDEIVEQYINKRVDHIIETRLGNIEQVIANCVFRIMKNPELFKSASWRYDQKTLLDYIKSKIDFEVHEFVHNRMVLSVKNPKTKRRGIFSL